MGFFSRILGDAKAFNKISNGVGNVTNLLDQYELDPDTAYLFFSAWITRVAILDVIEANNFPVTYKLYCPIKGHRTRITIAEVYLLTLTRLTNKLDDLSTYDRDMVHSILDKGEAFYEVDNQIPLKQKEIFQ